MKGSLWAIEAGWILCAAWAVGALAGESVEVALRAVAAQLSGSVPVRIDRERSLEAVVAVSDTLIFKYVFHDETTVNDPRFQAARYVEALKASLDQSTCRDPGTFELLRRGAKYNYLMVTRAGRKVIDFTLDYPGCLAMRR